MSMRLSGNIVLLLTATAVWAGPRPVVTPRLTGPLPVSLQHEVDAAMDRGRTWLSLQQGADGAWDGSNRVETTAMAWLALSADLSPAGTAATARAWAWLSEQTLETDQLWFKLVWAVQTGDLPAAESICTELRDARNAGTRQTQIPEDWVLLWLDARTFNREPTAAGDRAPADWRARKAREIVNTQLAAPDKPGAGYWRAPADTAPDDPLAAPAARTSLALLILREL
jgi:hypothetical protein